MYCLSLLWIIFVYFQPSFPKPILYQKSKKDKLYSCNIFISNSLFSQHLKKSLWVLNDKLGCIQCLFFWQQFQLFNDPFKISVKIDLIDNINGILLHSLFDKPYYLSDILFRPFLSNLGLLLNHRHLYWFLIALSYKLVNYFYPDWGTFFRHTLYFEILIYSLF